MTHNHYFPFRTELDREQAAIEEGKHHGLGLMGVFDGEQDWYGGKVQQIVCVVETSEKDKPSTSAGNSHGFEVRIKMLESRRSTRLARYLSSRRVLLMKISKEITQNANGVSSFCSRNLWSMGAYLCCFLPRMGQPMLWRFTQTLIGYLRRRLVIGLKWRSITFLSCLIILTWMRIKWLLPSKLLLLHSAH